MLFACIIHENDAVATEAFFPGNDPPWTKNGENASASFPYPTCFFIMG